MRWVLRILVGVVVAALVVGLYFIMMSGQHEWVFR